jgi:hypothetical protein
MRGLAILGMALSGLIPWGTLPAWMYHAQLPPPDHKLNIELYGINWVDLVFPFFLLAMGAAIPLSLKPKIPADDDERWGQKWLQIIAGILLRGAILMLFAICVQTFRGAAKPTTDWQWMSVLYFFGMVLALIRLPKTVPTPLTVMLRVVGCAIVLFGLVQEGIKPGQYDVILMVLANVYVTAALIWLAVRNRPSTIFFVIGAVAAMFLASASPGTAKYLFGLNWGFGQGEFQKYLLVVLPGLIIGDLGVPPRNGRRTAMSSGFASLIALIAVFGVPLTVTEFREVPLSTLFTTLFAIYALWLVREDAFQTVIHRWGWGLVIIGLIAEPIGGGIRKDWATISYLLVTPGLAILFYGVLSWLHQRMGRSDLVEVSDRSVSAFARSIRGLTQISGDRPGFLALVGQNPLIGYIAITNLAWSVPRLSGLHEWQNNQPWDPWQRAGYALVLTLAVGAVAALFSRIKVFARA